MDLERPKKTTERKKPKKKQMIFSRNSQTAKSFVISSEINRRRH